MLGFIYWIKLTSSHAVIFYTVEVSKGCDVTVTMYCKQQNILKKQRICNKQKNVFHVKFQIYQIRETGFKKKYLYSCFAAMN